MIFGDIMFCVFRFKYIYPTVGHKLDPLLVTANV